MAEDKKGQIFVNTIIYKGNLVAYKKISKSNFNINRNLLIELKRVSIITEHLFES